MNYSEIHNDCHAAGMAAGIKHRPVPVLVGQGTSLFSTEIDYTKQTFLLDDGACGYAWVTIHPGNSKLAREFTKLGIARKAYGGGVQIWVSEFGQSVDRKEAYAYAYAEKLRELTGEDRIYAGSRMD